MTLSLTHTNTQKVQYIYTVIHLSNTNGPSPKSPINGNFVPLVLVTGRTGPSQNSSKLEREEKQRITVRQQCQRTAGCWGCRREREPVGQPELWRIPTRGNELESSHWVTQQGRRTYFHSLNNLALCGSAPTQQQRRICVCERCSLQ